MRLSVKEMKAQKKAKKDEEEKKGKGIHDRKIDAMLKVPPGRGRISNPNY